MSHDHEQEPLHYTNAELDALVKQGYDGGDVKAGFIGVFAIATILALVGIILAVSGYYDRVREQQMFVKVLEPKSEELVNLRAREDTRLGAYKYADRGKGTVALPIARAMELLLQESATGKPFYPGQPTPVKILEPEKGPEKGNVAPAKAN